MEIVMETNVDTTVRQKDDGLWYVYVLDRAVGHGSVSRDVAEALMRWVDSGMQDWVDVFSDILDKAAKETGQ